MKSKKGQIGGILGDVFLGIFIVFMFIFSLIIGYTIWSNFNNEIQALDNVDQDVKDEINSWTNLFFFLDKLVLLLFVILWGSAIASSILTNPDHPFFFIVSLGVLFILTVASFILVDFGTQIFDSGVLATYSSDLSNSKFFYNNLHFISFFVMVITSIYFYTKGNYGVGAGVR